MASNMMLAVYVKSSIPVLEEHLQIVTEDASKLHRAHAMHGRLADERPATMSSSAPASAATGSSGGSTSGMIPNASASPVPTTTAAGAAP